MTSEKIDHLLEHIYLLHEESKSDIDDIMTVQCDHIAHEESTDTLAVLGELNFVNIVEETVHLTDDGREKAERIIRRHRLTERLLSDVLGMPEEKMVAQACKLEHIISHEVADSICTLLGHPAACPHGRTIPRGRCCALNSIEVKPLVMPLNKLDIGGWSKIMFTTPAFHKQYERLTLLGVTPGTLLKLYQKLPSYVVKVGETEIALDTEVAREIFVRPVEEPVA